MKWEKLNSIDQLDAISLLSKEQPIVIFKHSTRCSISSSALNRIERSWKEEEMKNIKPYYLDLIAHRDVSNKIAEVFGIAHESPQVLIIKDGKCVYNASHMAINYSEVSRQALKEVV